MSAALGVVSAGHPVTAQAGCIALESGGNAFDAVLAALATACVTEPVLASLGGGGFLTAWPADHEPRVYDFFVQTPRTRRNANEIDFFPVLADFGAATQEFHIGLGAVATPGLVKGFLRVHGDLGHLPLPLLLEPAIAAARDGVEVRPLQAYLFDVVSAIFTSQPATLNTYGSLRERGKLLRSGELMRLPDLAATFEALARGDERLFTEGEIARAIADLGRELGGHLTIDDLAAYQVEVRTPLTLERGDFRLAMNPPPSTGGILIAFALGLLKEVDFGRCRPGSRGHLEPLVRAMEATSKARVDSGLDAGGAAFARLSRPDFLEAYRNQVLGRPTALRGTTHISAIDAAGNAASLTVSNGESCGHIVPGTGILLNNMLGEEDINPKGFNAWAPDTRMASMMAPSILRGHDGEVMAVGSGGSNRIRTAILQVLINLIDFAMSPEAAVEAPRAHFERGILNLEPGLAEGVVDALAALAPETRYWPERNLFFGGVHTAAWNARAGFAGAGDPRRGGVSAFA